MLDLTETTKNEDLLVVRNLMRYPLLVLVDFAVEKGRESTFASI